MYQLFLGYIRLHLWLGFVVNVFSIIWLRENSTTKLIFNKACIWEKFSSTELSINDLFLPWRLIGATTILPLLGVRRTLRHPLQLFNPFAQSGSSPSPQISQPLVHLGQPSISHPNPLSVHPPSSENDGFRTVVSKRSRDQLKIGASQHSIAIEAKSFRIFQKLTVHGIAIQISEQRPALFHTILVPLEALAWLKNTFR